MPHSTRKIIVRIGLAVIVAVGMLSAFVALELRSMSRARPPASIRTMEDFRAWKKDGVTGRGTFEANGRNYTVMLGRNARHLASGPSAYLFDSNDQFIDWTADMGDFYTAKRGFDLTSGHVKNIKLEGH
jgi:hypothetical protein